MKSRSLAANNQVRGNRGHDRIAVTGWGNDVRGRRGLDQTWVNNWKQPQAIEVRPPIANQPFQQPPVMTPQIQQFLDVLTQFFEMFCGPQLPQYRS